MPITKIEFTYVDNKKRTCIFVENCANSKHKASHTVRLQGRPIKDVKTINIEIYNKYMKLAKIQKATA